jgi:hypothetical protein
MRLVHRNYYWLLAVLTGASVWVAIGQHQVGFLAVKIGNQFLRCLDVSGDGFGVLCVHGSPDL